MITTTGLDSELTEQCGPQLVVPVLNTCFAANAANARWGSLYDALYGSDVFPDTGEIARGAAYSPTRGARVIAYGRALLDAHFPLSGASHTAVERYCVHDGGLDAQVDGAVGALSDPRRSTSSLVIERATF